VVRVEIHDCWAMTHTISSRDPELIGRWFAEHAAQLMTADARMNDCRLHIWPQDHAEMELIRSSHEEWQMDQDSLLALAGHILQVSKDLAGREEMTTAARERGL